MKKYTVTIKVNIEADSLEDAQDRANNINVYYNLSKGGDELDPSVTDVEERKKPMMTIKYDFLRGAIDFETAKKELFEYAPHPDAVNSNNEVLRLWKYDKITNEKNEEAIL